MRPLRWIAVLLPLACALLAARPLPDRGGTEFWGIAWLDKNINLVACRVPDKGVLDAEQCRQLVKPGTLIKVSRPDFTWQDFRVTGLAYTSQETPDLGTMYFSGEYAAPARPAGLINIMVPDNPTYRGLAADWLRGQGLDPVNLKLARLVRADLESDGQDELLLQLEPAQWDFFDNRRAMYSVILLRRLVDGAVQQRALGQSLGRDLQPEDLLLRYELINLADVDNDGALDVLIRSSYYEGTSFYFLPVLGPNADKPQGGWGLGV